MTLEEAKKILKKEGFVVERFLGVLVEDVKTASWEKIEVSEAMRVVAENGYLALMEESKYKERKARLKKECEKNTKVPGSTEKRIKEDSGVNPALKESASQFNDALLDEQAKEIKRLKKENAELLGIVERMKLDVKEVDINFNAVCKENERLNEKIREIIKEKSNLEDQITVLNACKKHNDKIDRKQIKCLGKENARLNGIIHDKNEVIADLTHELKAKHKKYVWYKGAYDAAQQILNTIADYAAKHPDKKISDPMVEENHPTEDKPEEVDVDEILERVRKALEEGHTVSIDYKD